MKLIDWPNSDLLRAYVQGLIDNFPSQKFFLQQFADELDDQLNKENAALPVPVIEALLQFAKDVWATEDFKRQLPPFTTHLTNTLEGAKYRDELLALQMKAGNPERTIGMLVDIVFTAVVQVLRRLPMHIPDGQYLVPITHYLNVPETVADVLSAFNQDTGPSKLLSTIQDTLARNALEISNNKPDKLIPPTAYKGNPLDYLKNTPLVNLFDIPIPFGLPDRQRFEGQWIVAPSGRGKTTLLFSMLKEDLEKDASIIILDSKGDLSNTVRHLERAKHRLVLLEPDEQYPLAINPLDLGATSTHTIELIEYVFSALLQAETTALQSTLFRSVVLLLQKHPNATFLDLRRVLTEGWKTNYADAVRKLDPEDADFFLRGEFDSNTYKQTKQEVLWRVRDLTTRIPILRAMFSAPKTLIPMGELMDAKKVVVIDNTKRLLGDDGTEFLGRFFLAMIRAAADQRSHLPDEQKVPVFCYVDEAHNVIKRDEKLASILQECRSQKIAMILAHQAISQIESAKTLGALQDCAIRYANSDEEAPDLAPRLRTTPEFLRSLPVGTFAAFIRDLTPTAVPIRIQIPKLGPTMSPQDFTALRQTMRERYSLKPTPPPTDEPKSRKFA